MAATGGSAPPKSSNTTTKKKTGKSKGSPHETPPEVIAQIVGYYMSGEFSNAAEIAEHVGVAKKTVLKYQKYIPKDLVLFKDSKKDTDATARVEDLLIGFLSTSLESLQRINAVTNDEEWIKRQTAVELATLYGTKADRVLKILSAIQAANDPHVSGVENS